MIQAAPADLNEMPGAHEFPHVIALLLLIVLLTVSVEFWSGRRNPDKTIANAINPLSWLILIPFTILYAGFVYFAPAFIITAVIKLVSGEGEMIKAVNFPTEFADPMFKLALMICLVDNLTETGRYEKKSTFKIHFVLYSIVLPLSYYGAMIVAWVLARIIAAGGGFRPEFVAAAGSLFSLPVFNLNSGLNWLIIAALFLIGGLLFHPVVEMRRQ